MVVHTVFSLNFSTTIIVIILFISSTSRGYPDKYDDYEDCSIPWSCGNLTNIGYPFWGSDRPPYCGHPELELKYCNVDSKDYPILGQDHAFDSHDDDHHNADVKVLGIWNSTESLMTIKLEVQIQPNYSCPTPPDIGVFREYPFNYSTNFTFTRLFYDCPDCINPPASYSNTCFDFLNNKTACYLENQTCKTFDVPVLKEELIKLNQGSERLEDALNKGFEVEFDYSKCFNCQNSGGVCGSDYQSFVCYCKDHPHLYIDKCPKSGKWKAKLIFGLGTLGGVVLVIFIGLVCSCRSIRPTRKISIFSKGIGRQHRNIEAFLKIYGSLAPKRYTYSDVRSMTNNFKDKLGEGGYATVYKGKLHNGRLVAVKLLKQVKGNGDDFINEVASIGRTNHVNIVTLLGFCFEGNKRALIYEFMSNGSLERFTYRGASYVEFSWEKRYDIALGIAKGLDYLHRGCNARILHFDIKPHNVLLDEEFQPKISDFGLARLCPQQESTISTLEARGTIGYIAPELVCRSFGGVSHKSDVYSYGMMVLDLTCGRTNVSAEVHQSSELYFPQWIYNRLELGEEVVVSGILSDKEKEFQRKMILVSLWCIQTYPSCRPSMSRVIEMLSGCLESIQIPPKPYISSPPRLALDSSGTPTT